MIMADRSTPIDALISRYGTAPIGAVHYDEKGRPYFMQPRKCSRCGGAGKSDRWAMTGYTCFDCGGSGDHKGGPLSTTLYTAEEVAKLDAAKAKRNAKKVAALDAKLAAEQQAAAERRDAFLVEFGDLIGRANAYLDARFGPAILAGDNPDDDNEYPNDDRAANFVADIIEKADRKCLITEGQVTAIEKEIARWNEQQAAKAASQHIGKVGERLSLTVDILSVIGTTRKKFNAPWLDEIQYITKMRDAAGNTFSVFSTAFAPARKAKLVIKGTVKNHETYRDEKQTVLKTIKIIETLEKGEPRQQDDD
jgi:hypothetical protein